VASLLRDRYFRVGEPRPLRELRVSVEARRRGVRTPEVMAVSLHAGRWFLRADIATTYVPDSEDLAQLGFSQNSAGQAVRSEDQRRAAFSAAGRLPEELAAAGIAHPDLNLKNILIRFGGGAPEAWVLDLDRARVGRASAAAMRSRLERSCAKWERNSGRALAPGLRAALLGG
jgi:3-deoxy-D-manno-octulosonic acid kinase